MPYKSFSLVFISINKFQWPSNHYIKHLAHRVYVYTIGSCPLNIYIHTTPTINPYGFLMALKRSVSVFSFRQIVQKPGAQDLKLAMRDLSKNVAQSVSELVKSCEALKGMIGCGYLIYKFMFSCKCKISQICVYDS